MKGNGFIYTKEELDYIMSLCEKYDLYIMNDEIWSDIVYPDAKFESIYCLGNERCHRVMSVFGYSKSFGLAGLRVGCVYTTNDAKSILTRSKIHMLFVWARSALR